MAEVKQHSDGSIGVIRERDSQDCMRAGGVAGPAGSNSPSYVPGSSMSFNIAGGTDTGGGVLSWQNKFPFDILVTGAVVNVTTIATAACTLSIGGTSTSGTTSSSTLISGQDVHSATGAFTSAAPVAVLVPQNKWITGSVASGASAGLVGYVYVAYRPVTP